MTRFSTVFVTFCILVISLGIGTVLYATFGLSLQMALLLCGLLFAALIIFHSQSIVRAERIELKEKIHDLEKVSQQILRDNNAIREKLAIALKSSSGQKNGDSEALQGDIRALEASVGELTEIISKMETDIEALSVNGAQIETKTKDHPSNGFTEYSHVPEDVQEGSAYGREDKVSSQNDFEDKRISAAYEDEDRTSRQYSSRNSGGGSIEEPVMPSDPLPGLTDKGNLLQKPETSFQHSNAFSHAYNATDIKKSKFDGTKHELNVSTDTTRPFETQPARQVNLTRQSDAGHMMAKVTENGYDHPYSRNQSNLQPPHASFTNEQDHAAPRRQDNDSKNSFMQTNNMIRSGEMAKRYGGRNTGYSAGTDEHFYPEDPVNRQIGTAIQSRNVEILLQPVVTLPQRQAAIYEALARLRLADGSLLKPSNFLQPARSMGLVPMLDNQMFSDTIAVLRKLTLRSKKVKIFCNMGGETIADNDVFSHILSYAEANRAYAGAIILQFQQQDFEQFSPIELEALHALRELGCRFSLNQVTDLSVDFTVLANRGFRYLKINVAKLLGRSPVRGADIHFADLSRHVQRHGLQLIVDEVAQEYEVVELLEYNVEYAQGNLFSKPRPVKAEVLRRDDRQTLPSDDRFRQRTTGTH